MSDMQTRVDGLARVLWQLECRAAARFEDEVAAIRAGFCSDARTILASDALAAILADARREGAAEATAAVAAQVEALPRYGFNDALLLVSDVRAALTPDAGAALRARDAEAWDEGYDASRYPETPNPYRDALEARTEA